MDVNEFSNKLFSIGYELGFSDMEIYYIDSEEFEVTAYEKSIDSYKINTNIGLSFRGIRNRKMGYAYTERFEDSDIKFLLESAAENAEESEADVDASVYSGGSEYKKIKDNELLDQEISIKIQDVLKMERDALNYDGRIKSVNYCLVSTGKGKRKIMNTRGLNLDDSSGMAIAYLSLVAQNGNETKSGSKFMLNSDYRKIDLNEVVKGAAEEALSKFGASPVKTGKYKVILRHDVASSLLAAFSGIFSSDSAQKGLSLLGGKIDTRIASEKITIIDNPYYEAAPFSASFDDEGVASLEKDIVRDGILKTLLYNIKTAKKEGKLSTGNGFKPSYKSPVAVTPTNMYIAPGERSLKEATESMDKAVLITSLSGIHSGTNPISGDFSLAAEGFLIENGKIIRPVEQITIADNFYKMLLKIEEVLSDFEFNLPGVACFGSGSVIVSEMDIAGE